jgi:porphobilinogen synthase
MPKRSTKFPRYRRLRSSPILRELVADVTLEPKNLVLPIFVKEGKGVRSEVKSMPGVFQLSPDQVLIELKQAQKLGIKAFILFGVVDSRLKDEKGTCALDPDNIICRTLKQIKKAGTDMIAITDLCFCEYTSHGHCGLLTGKGKHAHVDNDATLEALSVQALNHVRAGADIIAPSGMMDGLVGSLRTALDQNGYSHLPILSYAVKYASAFYGPFRDAADSAPAFGDRRAYQMDGRRVREALLEAKADLEQGADMIMVKPGLPYLDILQQLRSSLNVPLAAYQVSGEYAMIKAAAKQGWLDEGAVMMESLYAFRRAGADLILTYFAKEGARRLKK